MSLVGQTTLQEQEYFPLGDINPALMMSTMMRKMMNRKLSKMIMNY